MFCQFLKPKAETNYLSYYRPTRGAFCPPPPPPPPPPPSRFCSPELDWFVWQSGVQPFICTHVQLKGPIHIVSLHYPDHGAVGICIFSRFMIRPRIKMRNELEPESDSINNPSIFLNSITLGTLLSYLYHPHPPHLAMLKKQLFFWLASLKCYLHLYCYAAIYTAIPTVKLSSSTYCNPSAIPVCIAVLFLHTLLFTYITLLYSNTAFLPHSASTCIWSLWWAKMIHFPICFFI